MMKIPFPYAEVVDLIENPVRYKQYNTHVDEVNILSEIDHDTRIIEVSLKKTSLWYMA